MVFPRVPLCAVMCFFLSSLVSALLSRVSFVGNTQVEVGSGCGQCTALMSKAFLPNTALGLRVHVYLVMLKKYTSTDFYVLANFYHERILIL